MVGLVGRGEDFGFVNEVDAEVLEDLGFGEVADAALAMTGMETAAMIFDELGAGHAGDAAFSADHGGDALQGHDGDGSGFFGDAACSTFMTSMMTPPLSISARPSLRRRLLGFPLFCDICNSFLCLNQAVLWLARK